MKIENPKEEAGRKKCPMHLIPLRVLEGVAYVFKNGADKYGEWNWREAGGNYSTYIGAALRHLRSFQEGEDFDKESSLHAIDHTITGLMILRDSILEGNAIDDRPISRVKNTLPRKRGKVSEKETN